ncbi:MAG: hypothetical protein D3912_09040 [Candidatus Electrothrix sp. AX1]|nr:hypothetical protein [Candidatus Electrothrix sp. AX1]
MSSVDFFISGYPKSGTTALYHYLKDHPDVFLPDLKEPHFFSVDFPGARSVTSIIDYEKLYADATSNQLKGDASASVIHSSEAINHILEYAPQAKFIVLVREPVAAVRSFHCELLYNLNEDETDFETAWNLQSSREKGKKNPTNCKESALLQYATIFRYREQLPLFFQKLPEEQRLIFVFEEFFSDPRNAYLKVLDFLELKDDGRTDFPAVNMSKKLRFRSLASYHRQLVDSNIFFYRITKNMLSRLGIHPSHMLARLNLKKGYKQELSPQFYSELRKHFEPDIETVEQLLGHSIQAWRL